jgi:tetratricopeptide (TPR) repeat protein
LAVRLGDRARAVARAARKRAARVWPAIVSWCRRRRVLAAGLAAGAVVLVVVSLLVVHHRAARRPGVTAAAGPAKPGQAAPAGKLAAVDELVARGDRKQALARLRELRKENPADADYPAAQARLLFELRRYEEGVAAFRSAIRRDPQRRGDPVLIRHVIDSMQNDGFAPAAQDFLRELGTPARDEVKEAARNHPSARVRERARELLRDWGRRPLFR